MEDVNWIEYQDSILLHKKNNHILFLPLPQYTSKYITFEATHTQYHAYLGSKSALLKIGEIYVNMPAVRFFSAAKPNYISVLFEDSSRIQVHQANALQFAEESLKNFSSIMTPACAGRTGKIYAAVGVPRTIEIEKDFIVVGGLLKVSRKNLGEITQI
jgi:hypothetical protein